MNESGNEFDGVYDSENGQPEKDSLQDILAAAHRAVFGSKLEPARKEHHKPANQIQHEPVSQEVVDHLLYPCCLARISVDSCLV
jgi:hypothetical protein